jgi:hypothetical protein
MSGEAPLIDPDEPILRRIARSPGYYNPQKAPPVESGAFRPNKNDTEGLSVYLERDVSPAELVAATNKPADRFLVARLKAADFYGLGLSLVPNPQPEGPAGHVLVPEINFNAYNDHSKRAAIKEVMLALAELASRNIVRDARG